MPKHEFRTMEGVCEKCHVNRSCELLPCEGDYWANDGAQYLLQTTTNPSTTDELRKEWRAEVKRWPEMDALGAGSWWMDKIESLLSRKEEEVKESMWKFLCERGYQKREIPDDEVKYTLVTQDFFDAIERK